MNEPRLLKGLWKYSQEGWELPIDVIAIFQPLLVRQKARPFAKASADAILFYGEDDDPKFIPTELKTLISMQKIESVSHVLFEQVGANAFDPTKCYF